MVRIALYPGSFDPPTNGHAGILRAALGLCDQLVVAVGVHPTKTPMLPAADRLELIEAVARPMAEEAGIALDVRSFDGLVVDLAGEVGATLLLRGLRDGGDLDYEMRMAAMNRAMAPGLQTIFMPATAETRHITATLVRQIAGLGGDIGAFVPPVVHARLMDRSRR